MNSIYTFVFPHVSEHTLGIGTAVVNRKYFCPYGELMF